MNSPPDRRWWWKRGRGHRPRKWWTRRESWFPCAEERRATGFSFSCRNRHTFPTWIAGASCGPGTPPCFARFCSARPFWPAYTSALQPLWCQPTSCLSTQCFSTLCFSAQEPDRQLRKFPCWLHRQPPETILVIRLAWFCAVVNDLLRYSAVPSPKIGPNSHWSLLL